MMNEYAKLIWQKHTSGQILTNDEVVNGRQIFKDLAKDLGECFGWQQAAVECHRFHNLLCEMANMRGVD